MSVIYGMVLFSIVQVAVLAVLKMRGDPARRDEGHEDEPAPDEETASNTKENIPDVVAVNATTSIATPSEASNTEAPTAPVAAAQASTDEHGLAVIPLDDEETLDAIH
jgi:hypothetical protein